MLIHHSNLVNLPRPLKICPMSARTYTSNSTKNSFPVQLNLHNSSCTSSKRAPASLAALNSPICKDLLLLRVPHRSRADTVKYKSNGLWRSSWQSRWAGGVDQDVRMRTKRRGWWWRGGTRGHKALHPIAIRLDWTLPAFSAPDHLAGKDPPFGPRSIVRRCLA